MKRRLPLTRMPCSSMSFCTRCLPTRTPRVTRSRQGRVPVGHAGLEHQALHRNRPGRPVTANEGVLQIGFLAKCVAAFPGKALPPLHACPLSAQPADFHPLGAHRRFAVSSCDLVLAMGLDPIKQRLVNHPQRFGCRSNSLLTRSTGLSASCLTSSVHRAIGVFVICVFPV